MAVSPEDLLSTPAAYATPGQLADARKYADLMTKSSTSSGKITSPYQGYAKIVQGLMGGLEENEADRQEAMQRAGAMLTSSRAMTGQAGTLGLGQQRMLGGGAALPTGLPGEGGTPTPTSREHVDLSAGNYPVPMEAAKAAIAENESGGRYGEIGPMVLRGSYAGDRAYGKYQVMGKDLQDRLAKAGLPQMSASQFLMNPRAQELQFEHEFGGLMQKYGTFNDAASMWFSGHPMRANDNSSDGWMTTPGYIAKANRTLRQWQQQNQSATGQGSGPQANLVSSPIRETPGVTASDAGPIGGPGAKLADASLLQRLGVLATMGASGEGLQSGEPQPNPEGVSPSERIAASMGPPPPTPNARIAAQMGPLGGPSPSERVASVMGPRPPVLSPSQIVDMAHAQHAPMMPGLTQVAPGLGTVPGATMAQPPMPAVPEAMPPVQPMVGGPAPPAAPPVAPPAPPPPAAAAAPPAPPAQSAAVARPALPGAPLPDVATPGPAVRPQIGGPGVPGQAVTPDGRAIPPPQFRPSPPARVPPAPPAQPAAPANAGTAPGFAPRTAPDQMHDPVSGHRYPVDPRDVYPHGAQLAALNAEWQNPWTPPDRLAAIAQIFASKEFEDSNQRKWLYSPYNRPVLSKDSPGIKAEMKISDNTIPVYINQGDDGVLRVINPLDQSSGGRPPAGGAAAGGGGGTSTSAAGPGGVAPAAPAPNAAEGATPGPLGPAVDRIKAWETQQAAAKKQAEDAAGLRAKYYDTLFRGFSGSAHTAANQKQNLNSLREIFNDKGYVPGNPTQDWVLKARKFGQALGVKGAGTAAPNELAEMLSGRILADTFANLRAVAEETGGEGPRIFKSMLDVEKDINLTTADSRQGALAKLNMIERAGNVIEHLGRMAREYRTSHGYALDENFENMIDDELNKSNIFEKGDIQTPEEKPAPVTRTTRDGKTVYQHPTDPKRWSTEPWSK